MKKVVITGGAGFIGAALASLFARNPQYDVTAIDNLTTGDWGRVHGPVRKINLDLVADNLFELEEILHQADLLFHLSAVKLHNINNSFDSLVKNNITGSQNVFEVAGIAKVKRVIFTSSLYSYGLPVNKLITENDELNPTTFYGASKVIGENILNINSKKFGFSSAIARLFFIYGPNQYADGGYKSVIVSNFERIKSGMKPIIKGTGNQVLDYLYIEDCVDALKLLGESTERGPFNISSGSGISILSLTELMMKIGNSSSFSVASPDWTEGTVRVGSNKKIKSALGWKPNVDLVEGLDKTWQSLGL